MNPLMAGKGMQTAAGKLDDYTGINFADIHNFVLSIFPEEEELMDEQNRILWNPIFYQAVEAKDRRERYKGIGMYSLTEALLVDHTEVVANANYAKVRQLSM